MPEIDLTDVMRGTGIAGTGFNVLRREATDGDDGRPVIVETLFEDQVGSVTPTGDNSLVREEGYSNSLKTIKVITPFKLRGVSKDPDDATKKFMPDLVNWPIGSADYYIVKVLDDWSQFGAGFTEAECIGYNYVQQAPA